MQARALPLTSSISCTVIEVGGRWRLGTWYRGDGSFYREPPPLARNTTFDTPDEAIQFLRSFCER